MQDSVRDVVTINSNYSAGSEEVTNGILLAGVTSKVTSIVLTRAVLKLIRVLCMAVRAGEVKR